MVPMLTLPLLIPMAPSRSFTFSNLRFLICKMSTIIPTPRLRVLNAVKKKKIGAHVLSYSMGFLPVLMGLGIENLFLFKAAILAVLEAGSPL